jgi:hypothetical protein
MGPLLIAALAGCGSGANDPPEAVLDGGVRSGTSAPEGRTADANIDSGFSADASTCQVAASDFDRSCSKDSDCVPVFEGNICEVGCGCPNAAINAGAQARYNARYQAAPRHDTATVICHCPCIAASMHCNAGVCEYAYCGEFLDAGL